MGSSSCTPPRVLARPEVGLHPRDEEDLAVVDVGVNQGQRLLIEKSNAKQINQFVEAQQSFQLRKINHPVRGI